MRSKRRIPTYAAIVLAISVTGGTASAQGWTILPDGTPTYATNFSTSAFFSCEGLHYGYLTGSCSAQGNTLTLTNGGASLLLTFTICDVVD